MTSASSPAVAVRPSTTGALVRIIRVVHPFPSLLNVAATVGLAFAAADGSPEADVVLRMALAMLCAQFAIGITNDIFDRELDAASKPWKPVASGLIPPAVAILSAIALIVSSIAVAASLGWASALLVVAGTACGLAYDAGLKRTILSPLPFMLAIPLLPAWVYVTLDAWEDVLWWLLPLGALIGLAIHLANTLPDVESDAAQGIRGLAHVLGVERATLLSWLAFAQALILAALIAPFLDKQAGSYAVALSAGTACLFASIIAVRSRGASALQLNFGLMSIGAVICAAGWLVAVT